jgi:poly-gamma-glutamate synthesis protein (capsule biosynthesis protein)
MNNITLIAVGDIAFSKPIERRIKENGYAYPFKNIKSILSSGDLIFGNLESPITDSSARNESHYSKLTDDPVLGKRVYLKASPLVTRSLKVAGFNVLSIANNHILDYQKQGLIDTVSNLSEVGILSVGAGLNLRFARRPAIIKVKSRKIGFLAYSYTYEATRDNYGCAPLWRFLVRQDVRFLRERADIVIVSFHYGKEFSSTPSKFQRSISHFAIDSGADIVLGHHPHVLQPVEIYKSKIIAYSLGNFLFDYNNYGVPLSKKLLHSTKLSAVLKLTLCDDGALTYDLFPVWMDENFQLKPYFNEVTRSITNFGREKAIYLDFRKTFLLFKLVLLSMKGNKSNIPLLASRALSECGLL